MARGRSMSMPALRFRAFGVPVEVRLSLVLLAVLIGYPMHQSPQLMLAWVAIAVSAVLIHEAGHAVAFIAFGMRPSITLHGGGGHTTGTDPGIRRMVGVSAAGPVAGLVAGLAVLMLAPYLPANEGTHRLVEDALLVTIGLSLLNLVPLGPFDGNTVLLGLVATATGGPPGVTGWMLGVVTIMVLVLAAVSLGMNQRRDPLIVIAATQWRSVPGLMGRPEGTKSAAAVFRVGRPAEAVALAEADLRRAPADIGTHLVRAGALAAMTRYAEAETAYGAILGMEPHNLQALAGRSGARRALGHQRAADEDLGLLLADPPPDAQGASAQFYGLYQAHRYGEGLTLIRMQLTEPGITASEADHLGLLEAVVECAMGDADAALRHAHALVAARPDDSGIHEIIAHASIQLGRSDAALSHAHRALAGAPRHPELLETLGIVERLSGHPELAYEALLDAAIARPQLPRARAELSVVFTQLGRHAEASAAISDLPSWTVDDPFVSYARGCLLAASGRYDEAKELVAKATGIRASLGSIARLDPDPGAAVCGGRGGRC